jgi:hypothetical protein
MLLGSLGFDCDAIAPGAGDQVLNALLMDGAGCLACVAFAVFPMDNGNVSATGRAAAIDRSVDYFVNHGDGPVDGGNCRPGD